MLLSLPDQMQLDQFFQEMNQTAGLEAKASAQKQKRGQKREDKSERTAIFYSKATKARTKARTAIFYSLPT